MTTIHDAAVRLGSLGGRTVSKRKAKAARENGKKGGRPPLHGPWCAKFIRLGFEMPGCRRAARRRAKQRRP